MDYSEFNYNEPVPATVQESCISKEQSWEPAARHYRNIEGRESRQNITTTTVVAQ